MPSLGEHFGFYAILTNPVMGYEFCTELLAARHVPFVQLRMKGRPPDEVRSTAEKMAAITRGSATRLIVNDDPEIARDTGADGVHLGQDDMPYAQAREIMGPDAIIGLSTHNPAQTAAACFEQPDYIGIGPVYATPTKAVPDPVIGIGGMREMLGIATVPAVAIGGISLERLPEVLDAGARNVCMVRPLNESTEPAKVLEKILVQTDTY